MKIGETADPIWDVLREIVFGNGVSDTASALDLARGWGLDAVDEDDVFEILGTLRKMGYEVRGHGTNPQIKSGHFLIPYRFPTLAPLSVQLRKSL
jgi:DNA (cytosine-5)-methyltransferase 1